LNGAAMSWTPSGSVPRGDERHGDHRQPDERQRLREHAEVRARQDLHTIDGRRPWRPDRRRRPRRRRREQHVHVAEDAGDARAVPRAEALRFHVERRRQQRAGQEALAGHRIEVSMAPSQIVEMKVRSLAGRDDHGRGARALRLRQRHLTSNAKGRRDPGDGA